MLEPAHIKTIRKQKLLETLPSEWQEELFPIIQAKVKSSHNKVVVLDDDPTGTQTVYGVPVLTHWPVESLESELLSDHPVFYLLTNSRSFPLSKAKKMNYEIGKHLTEAASKTNVGFVVISRSDSTLRGHFPGEVKALEESTDGAFDAWLIIPFFQEGGRITVNDIHYITEENRLIPAGKTEFARDVAFGYQNSNLKLWVEEKTSGEIQSGQVASITIEDIRLGGPDQVEERLLELNEKRVCIVNAVSTRDMEVFVLGLLRAEDKGRNFLYRTAASIIPVRAGIPEKPILPPEKLPLKGENGGLYVVGSHVPKTTKQIKALMNEANLVSLELRVEAILDEKRRAGEIDRIVLETEKGLQKGIDVMIYTSRRLIRGDDAEESLRISQIVSQGLVEVVTLVNTRPRYILTKGGITSSDIATMGLNVRRSLVLGQVLPGVPVWQLGEESRFPDLAYIVFPGNVGGTRALVKVAQSLAGDTGY